MAALAEIALSLVAFVGHFSIAVWLFNRLHAVALPRPAIKWLEKAAVTGRGGHCLWLSHSRGWRSGRGLFDARCIADRYGFVLGRLRGFVVSGGSARHSLAG